MKIQNIKLANLEVHFSSGVHQFDAEGIADIQPVELAQDILGLPGYFPVHTIDIPNPLQPKDGDKVIMEDGKAIEEMTGKELDQLAEQLMVEGYPLKGIKQAKIDSIEAHIEAHKE